METDKQASELAFNHNHSFAGPPLHSAQSPESSSNSINTRPISTPSPKTNSTPRDRHLSIIDSIDQHAVRALASQHKNKKSCRTHDANHGSFTICFFIEFLKRRASWIVRIPIEPVLHDVWTKLQRDVITMLSYNGRCRRDGRDSRARQQLLFYAYGQDESLLRDGPRHRLI
jgi:hypothetical protein